MATRKRGQKVKKDVAGSGFLNHVVSSSIIPGKFQAVYYQVLADLDFPNLSGDRQLLAWQIAYTTVSLYQVMDMSNVHNDADARVHAEKIKQLPKLQKALIDLINAFNGKRQQQELPAEDEEEKQDFKALLDQLVVHDKD